MLLAGIATLVHVAQPSPVLPLVAQTRLFDPPFTTLAIAALFATALFSTRAGFPLSFRPRPLLAALAGGALLGVLFALADQATRLSALQAEAAHVASVRPAFPWSLMVALASGLVESAVYCLVPVAFFSWLVGRILPTGDVHRAVTYIVPALFGILEALSTQAALPPERGLRSVLLPVVTAQGFLQGRTLITRGLLAALLVRVAAQLVWHFAWPLP